MPEGPFGFLPRPFAEERELSLHIFLEYDADTININELEDKLFDISEQIEREGILIKNIDIGILSSNKHIIMIELAITNINIQTVEDIRRIAASVKGYKNMIISSVSAQQIGRLQ